MVKRIFWLALIFACIHSRSLAQTPGYVRPDSSLSIEDNFNPDSLAISQTQHYSDSLKLVGDSLARLWIKAPDPNRPNKFLDSLIDLYTVDNFDFAAWAKKFPKKSTENNQGKPRLKGETWVIAVIICLILFFAILKNTFSKELSFITQSLYNNRVLGQIKKEYMMFNSWPSLFLYLLFGLTIGMFLYLSAKSYQITYPFKGFEWFLILSAIVIGAFTLKILGLRILGFIFGVQKIFGEYITILYLSYFNAALIFLPLIVAFSLTPNRFAEVYSYLAMFIVGLIFVIQFLRAGASILSNYRFSKTYLIIYLCALEVCPLLILFKALRF
jgi:hypothetical protein